MNELSDLLTKILSKIKFPPFSHKIIDRVYAVMANFSAVLGFMFADTR